MATNTDRIDQLQRDLGVMVGDLKRQWEVIQGIKDGAADTDDVARIEESLKRLQAELSEAQTAVVRQDERIKVLEKPGDHSAKLAAVEERLKTLEKGSDHPATLSAHDQRLKALEKGTDRLWQALPIILSALALLTAGYVAFMKK